MEEVDSIILHSLRQCGLEVPEEVTGLKEFTTELIVEGAVLCLRVINPAAGGGLSHVLPPGMSARFRLGMSLAQACQELGYPGEIGYQTFLYSSESEIRRLFLFLLEKLPKESATSADRPAGKMALLQRAIAEQIRMELATPWVPPLCRTPLLLSDPSRPVPFRSVPLSVPADVTDKTLRIPKGVQAYWSEVLPPVSGQCPSPARVAAAVLENNAAGVSAAQEWDAEWNNQGLASRLTPEEYRLRKRERLHKKVREQFRQAVTRGLADPVSALGVTAGVLPGGGGAPAGTAAVKGSRFVHTEKLIFTQEQDKPELLASPGDRRAVSEDTEQDVQARRAREAEELQERLQRTAAQVEALELDARRLRGGFMQVEEELGASQQALAEHRESFRVRKATLDLLPDAHNNAAKLQAVVESSAKRVLALTAQWESHRSPLVQQLRELKELGLSCQEASSRRVAQIREMRVKMKSTAEEVRNKEDLHRQLASDYESMPKDVARAAYTQRILEIVANIKRQKEEIGKVLADTREVQKDINGLAGKLERTFSVTDELLFKDAKKDETARKAYKHLAALHENCAQLIHTIEDTGAVMREIRDLEEQTELERSKKTLSNLERIVGDLRAMQHENSLLGARMHSA
ncbi:coiled-coil domain-containing protein 22-like isoform X2 [Lethenteron reissneri]|uniref:coiled-coil domain-containing protein 22-like isoform X2 n=1 Tax=Lethenteron reissneri TaxID=7753 RepID=UPI002AB6D72D|nr:coiled-coil domain-containing protein 22-like isoform X2 [Lethenteron reissneri]